MRMLKAMATERKEVVEQYLKDYPHLMKKPLARLLVKERPDLFASLESTRSVVRRLTGAFGKKSRRITGHKAPGVIDMQALSDQYNLIDGDVEVVVHEIPKECSRIGITGDWQIPFHDKDAILKIYKYLKDAGIDCLYLNGDIIDVVKLSSFCRDVNARNFLEEIDMFYEWMCFTRDLFGDIPIYYKMGNHEDRYERFMYQRSKELIGIPEFEFANIMGLREFDIKVIGSMDRTMAGDMPILHGHELQGGSTVSPAKNSFNKIRSSFIASHCHIPDSYIRKGLQGELFNCHTLGCGCQLSPKWNPLAMVNWGHGGGILYRNPDGTTKEVDNFRV